MNWKALVLDLDGTTLNEFNTVNKTVHHYIETLRKRGITVIIATGRTMEEAKDVLPPDLEVDGMVTANGMSAFTGGEQIVRHELPPELVEELAVKARNQRIYYEVHPNEGSRMALEEDKPYFIDGASEPKPESVDENEWLSRQEAVQGKVKWVSELQTGNIAKIYFFSRNEQKMERWKEELNKIKQRMAFTTASSTHHNVEVTVEGVSKATGLKLLFERFSLQADQVLAVGDGENDLPMFQLAGRCVAMKNASDFVKKQTDEVTEYSYKEDGLYRFLKKTFE